MLKYGTFCRECRKNLNIRAMRKWFWIKSGCEEAPQVVPACTNVGSNWFGCRVLAGRPVTTWVAAHIEGFLPGPSWLCWLLKKSVIRENCMEHGIGANIEDMWNQGEDQSMKSFCSANYFLQGKNNFRVKDKTRGIETTYYPASTWHLCPSHWRARMKLGCFGSTSTMEHLCGRMVSMTP